MSYGLTALSDAVLSSNPKYTHKYDYQRAKCEDPELIKGWFNRVQETIQRYGILEQDIYNMDESGFQMGVASTAKVICGSETRDSHAKSIQPGNREWITIIIAINTSGSALPPQIILAGKKHQSQWYSAIPKEYQISLSDNGWTNHLLQPLDISCFAPLKHYYGQKVREMA